MIIRKATELDKKKAWEIAKGLREWFDEGGIRDIKLDFGMNNVIVAVDKGKVLGFLCFTTYCGRMLLMWMGVKKDIERELERNFFIG